MSTRKSISCIIFTSLLFFSGCDLLLTTPIDQAEEIVKTQLKSPSSFKRIHGEVIWQGKNSNDMPAYVVSVLYDSANSFGAILRGCMYVSYSETKEKKVTWNKEFGIRDYTEMLKICDESTPLEIKKNLAKTLIDVNFKIN